jgi:hypothetical protein
MFAPGRSLAVICNCFMRAHHRPITISALSRGWSLLRVRRIPRDTLTGWARGFILGWEVQHLKAVAAWLTKEGCPGEISFC